jgi:hypothetical protein
LGQRLRESRCRSNKQDKIIPPDWISFPFKALPYFPGYRKIKDPPRQQPKSILLIPAILYYDFFYDIHPHAFGAFFSRRIMSGLSKKSSPEKG